MESEFFWVHMIHLRLEFVCNIQIKSLYSWWQPKKGPGSTHINDFDHFKTSRAPFDALNHGELCPPNTGCETVDLPSFTSDSSNNKKINIPLNNYYLNIRICLQLFQTSMLFGLCINAKKTQAKKQKCYGFQHRISLSSMNIFSAMGEVVYGFTQDDMPTINIFKM